MTLEERVARLERELSDLAAVAFSALHNANVTFGGYMEMLGIDAEKAKKAAEAKGAKLMADALLPIEMALAMKPLPVPIDVPVREQMSRIAKTVRTAAQMMKKPSGSGGDDGLN